MVLNEYEYRSAEQGSEQHPGIPSPAGNVTIMKRWSSRLCAKSPHGQRPQPRRERRFTRGATPRAARRTRVMHSARPERGTSAPRRCARLPPTNPDHMPCFSERIHEHAVALAITPASCCLCGAQGLLAVAALCFAPCRHDPSPLQLLHLLYSLLERGNLGLLDTIATAFRIAMRARFSATAAHMAMMGATLWWPQGCPPTQ